MFFTVSSGKVFHILDNAEAGSAPMPCGRRLDNYSLWMMKQNKPSPYVFRELPVGGKLCKVCEQGVKERSF